jgi:hypothetical protein
MGTARIARLRTLRPLGNHRCRSGGPWRVKCLADASAVNQTRILGGDSETRAPEKDRSGNVGKPTGSPGKPERGAFQRYWPFSASPCLSAVNRKDKEFAVGLFGSPDKIRTCNLSVNTRSDAVRNAAPPRKRPPEKAIAVYPKGKKAAAAGNRAGEWRMPITRSMVRRMLRRYASASVAASTEVVLHQRHNAPMYSPNSRRCGLRKTEACDKSIVQRRHSCPHALDELQ